MNIINGEKDPTENLTDFDLDSGIAEISADLFRQGEGSGNEDEAPAGAETEGTPAASPAVEKAPSQQTPEEAPAENTEQVQETGAPKTWSKEALADWATLPPRAQQEILKREEDFFRGISGYKERAEAGDRYAQVVQPYAPILAAENVDPVQLFQSFAANHYLLTRGTEAQKLELAANMIQGYGLDFNKLINFVGDRILEPADPRVTALEAQVTELRNAGQSRQQQDQAATVERLNTEIDAFAKDPAHPFFEELVNDIAQVFQAGQANNLQEAYEKAVYLNPVTRQKELDRLTAEKAQSLTSEQTARQTKIARSSAADISLDPKSRNGTVPVGSLDDSLAEAMARINARA